MYGQCFGYSASDEAEEAREEAIASLADTLEVELRASREAVLDADKRRSGEQSSEHYDAVETALADFWSGEPGDQIYALAKVHAISRREMIRQMAEDAARKEMEAIEERMAEEAREANLRG